MLGGSTIWFGKQVQCIVSVEHDQSWYENVTLRLEHEEIRTVDLRFIPKGPPIPYAESILSFAEGFFDLVLVDGRNRVLCIKNALSRLRVGGWLVLDNADRQRYVDGIALMNTWERFDFQDQWVTSIFRKPHE